MRGPNRWSRQPGSELPRDANENWAQSDFVSLNEVFIESDARRFVPNKFNYNIIWKKFLVIIQSPVHKEV